jgi:hypothetical protein
MRATTYGLDVAKRVFQMYWVDAQTGEIVNRRFGRDELIGFLGQRPPGRVALEACGSGHWCPSLCSGSWLTESSSGSDSSRRTRRHFFGCKALSAWVHF